MDADATNAPEHVKLVGMSQQDSISDQECSLPAESPYRAFADARGILTEVWKRDGDELVVPDLLSRDYIDFLNWAARFHNKVADGFQLPKNAIFLLNAGEVADHFKNQVKVILVESNGGLVVPANPSDSALTLRQGCEIRNSSLYGNATFHPIYEAIIEPLTSPPQETLVARDSPLWVSEPVYKELIAELAKEGSEVRSLSSATVDRTFVYVDVSEFSKRPAGHQLLILNALIGVTNDNTWWNNGASAESRADREASLCIGDGYIFVFRTPIHGAYFGAYFAGLIERLISINKLPEFHFRIGIHTGPVYRFWDQWGAASDQGRWNYIGQGIIEGERVLTAIGKDKDDVVYISGETRKKIMGTDTGREQHDISPWLQNHGRQADKHGQPRRVYEINHSGWIGHTLDMIISVAKRPE